MENLFNKVKTQKIDGLVQVCLVRNDGAMLGVFNLTRHYDKNCKSYYYKNDCNGVCFDTITEAKQYVLKNKNNFLPE